MGELQNAKMLGGIGALITLVGGFIPTVGLIVVIAGLVLVFIAINKISEATKKEAIFKNYLLYFIFSVVAIVAVIGIFFVTFGTIGGFEIISDMAAGNTMTQEEVAEYFTSVLGPLATGCLSALVVGWVLLLISAIFYRRSYDEISRETNVNLFKTTGLVYLIGAATLIIVVGLFIILSQKYLK